MSEESKKIVESYIQAYGSERILKQMDINPNVRAGFEMQSDGSILLSSDSRVSNSTYLKDTLSNKGIRVDAHSTENYPVSSRAGYRNLETATVSSEEMAAALQRFSKEDKYGFMNPKESAEEKKKFDEVIKKYLEDAPPGQ